MSNVLNDFKEEMRKLFRCSEKDLDFGIYRIINQKNRLIDKYLDKELPAKIKEYLKKLIKLKREEIDKEIKEMEREAGKLGLTPEKVPKYKDRYLELLEKRKMTQNIEDYEKLIYKHIINFFSRYYKDGDFISRFFFKDMYLIPYDGSEVYLHWATRNMYFVKSSTKYKRFSFSAPRKSVLLRVVEVEEEKGNKKGGNKYFVLAEPEMEETDDERIFNFKLVTENDEIKSLGSNKTERQRKINEMIADIIHKKAHVEKEKVVKYIEKFQRNYVEDFFIHRNLKDFLLNQMNFYINQEIVDIDSYLSKGETNEGMLAVASVFREIAIDIINKLHLLEEFKKKAWEKKKFVLDTEYVVTLDKLEGAEILGEIVKELKKQASDLKDSDVKEMTSKTFKKTKDLDERREIHYKLRKMKNQWLEWIWLEIIDAKSKKDIGNILKLLQEKNLKGKTKLPENLKFLPIDTYYFSEDLKWKILEALSEKAQEKKNGLDDLLDGILIQSDNFQALNLLMEKYQDKIQTIYIDPPFNLGTNPDFPYKVNYKDSTWITMLENRISLARDLINEKGSMFVRCDYNGNMYVRLLMNEIFGEENFRNEIVIKKNEALPKTTNNKFTEKTEILIFFSKTEDNILNRIMIERGEESYWGELGTRPSNKEINPPRVIGGIEFHPPKFRRWSYSQESLERMYKESRLKIEDGKLKILIDKKSVGNDWLDINGYSSTPQYGFKTENHEQLLKRVIQSTSNPGDWVMDFFLGSGTTTAVAHKLGRKWIGVEMGDHFWTVVLPRMKKVLAYDKSGISKEKDVKETYNEKTAGGFFKYHVIEQYEDTLENIKFKGIISNEKLERFVRSSGEIIEYMLEDGIDKGKSKTFLGVDTEKHFKGIKIKVLKEDGSHEEKELDLIETFNYLAGLKIWKMFKRRFGNKDYYVVTGEMRNQSVMIVWREPCKNDKEKREDEKNIRVLLEDREYERIFVNSDTFLRNYSNIYDEMRNLLW